MRIAWAFEASTAHQRHIFSSLVPAVLILLTVLPLSSGTSHAPTTASNICLSHKTCSSCILANVDCFWNISTQSCVYTGNIDIKLDYFYNSSKRHLPIENITLWLQNQSSAALGLQQCPDLQCSLINVSFSYLSCSPQGMLTFAYVPIFSQSLIFTSVIFSSRYSTLNTTTITFYVFFYEFFLSYFACRFCRKQTQNVEASAHVAILILGRWFSS